MSTVTARINEIKQPKGGYIKLSQFSVEEIADGNILNISENIHPTVIGMAVDYLTRYMMGAKIEKAFEISLRGATIARDCGRNVEETKQYLKHIKGLDDDSIINACKMVTFDVWYRNSPSIATTSKPASETNPDCDTIQNIRIMVERSMSFFKKYGPITKDGFTFETAGYTKTVNAGDGDFLTNDTLWDFKVSKSNPKSTNTLQVLMYWIMGQHSGKEEFKGIKKLGIFNPRLNKIYTLNIEDIPKEIIKTVESDVICYWNENLFNVIMDSKEGANG